MLDSSLDYIQSIRDRPVWQPIPVNVRAAIDGESLPEHGQSLSNVCRDVLDYVIPYSYGNRHPRFWGWVFGAGTLGGALADMIAAAMNANTGSGTHSPILVERIVIKWMRQLFGFTHENSGGLIVSGTSMATVLCMAAARQRTLPTVRQDGLVDRSQLAAYASTETHMCVIRALELLGLGSKMMRRIPVDENFCIKIDDLKEAIRNDREQGLTPFCIVGNAGMFILVTR
jgi:glutamate/tyrosine decarboxylase-like PLP-dependent enzyme